MLNPDDNSICLASDTEIEGVDKEEGKPIVEIEGSVSEVFPNGAYDWAIYCVDPEDNSLITSDVYREKYPPVPTDASVRTERDRLIAQADILVFKAEDRGVDTAIYRAYREALRSITEQEGFPHNVVWPEQPPEPV
jgi:hypothetical protein